MSDNNSGVEIIYIHSPHRLPPVSKVKLIPEPEKYDYVYYKNLKKISRVIHGRKKYLIHSDVALCSKQLIKHSKLARISYMKKQIFNYY